MINLKNLSKAIKKEDILIWGKQDDINYISNGYFILKTPFKIEGSALSKMVSMLGTAPQNGECIKKPQGKYNNDTIVVSNFNLDNNSRNENLFKLCEQTEGLEDIVNTNLIAIDYKYRKVVFANKNNEYIYIQEKNANLIDLDDVETLQGSKNTAPIFFRNGHETAMILPVRCGEQNEYLK